MRLKGRKRHVCCSRFLPPSRLPLFNLNDIFTRCKATSLLLFPSRVHLMRPRASRKTSVVIHVYLVNILDAYEAPGALPVHVPGPSSNSLRLARPGPSQTSIRSSFRWCWCERLVFIHNSSPAAKSKRNSFGVASCLRRHGALPPRRPSPRCLSRRWGRRWGRPAGGCTITTYLCPFGPD